MPPDEQSSGHSELRTERRRGLTALEDSERVLNSRMKNMTLDPMFCRQHLPVVESGGNSDVILGR